MYTIPTFCSNSAPIPTPMCNCGLTINATNNTVSPNHYVLKSQFSSLSLPSCFGISPHDINYMGLGQLTNAYDDKGYIWWAATSQFKYNSPGQNIIISAPLHPTTVSVSAGYSGGVSGPAFTYGSGPYYFNANSRTTFNGGVISNWPPQYYTSGSFIINNAVTFTNPNNVSPSITGSNVPSDIQKYDKAMKILG